jgi:hypothetical protein
LSSPDVSAIDDRIDRVEQHLDEIKTMLRAYYASDPYEARGKYDPDAQTMTRQIRITKQLPVRCHTLVGELLHDLRSALDHLVCEFIRAAGGSSCENTQFPICKFAPPPDANGIVRIPIGGAVSPESHTLIEGAQPYNWGTDFLHHPLWRLHRLAIIDRHRHIATRGVGLESISFGGGVDGPIPAFTWTGRTVRSDEWGAEVLLTADSGADMQGNTIFEVIIHEPGPDPIGFNVPLLQTLVDAHEEVRKVVTAAKAAGLI